jgi:hypothetical protein
MSIHPALRFGCGATFRLSTLDRGLRLRLRLRLYLSRNLTLAGQQCLSGFALHRRKLKAVAKQLPNQDSLRINRGRLLYDKISQHGIGQDEENRQQRKQANGLLPWHLVRVLKENGQAAPRLLLTTTSTGGNAACAPLGGTSVGY